MLKSLITKVTSSDTFKEWQESNDAAFCSHAMLVVDDGKASSWQIGFYVPDRDKMANFEVHELGIRMDKEDDVLKKPGDKVLELPIDKVAKDFSAIQKKAKEFAKKKCPDPVNKEIYILLHLPKLGTIWNVTFVTISFKTINMKIDAKTGKVADHTIQSLLDMMSSGNK